MTVSKIEQFVDCVLWVPPLWHMNYCSNFFLKINFRAITFCSYHLQLTGALPVYLVGVESINIWEVFIDFFFYVLGWIWSIRDFYCLLCSVLLTAALKSTNATELTVQLMQFRALGLLTI